VRDANDGVVLNTDLSEREDLGPTHEDGNTVVLTAVDRDDGGPGLQNRMILRDEDGLARPIVIDLEQYELI
jgi:hypothetical protein